MFLLRYSIADLNNEINKIKKKNMQGVKCYQEVLTNLEKAHNQNRD